MFGYVKLPVMTVTGGRAITTAAKSATASTPTSRTATKGGQGQWALAALGRGPARGRACGRAFGRGRDGASAGDCHNGEFDISKHPLMNPCQDLDSTPPPRCRSDGTVSSIRDITVRYLINNVRL